MFSFGHEVVPSHLSFWKAHIHEENYTSVHGEDEHIQPCAAIPSLFGMNKASRGFATSQTDIISQAEYAKVLDYLGKERVADDFKIENFLKSCVTYFWVSGLASCPSLRNSPQTVFLEFLSSEYALSSSQLHGWQISIPAMILHRSKGAADPKRALSC